MPSNVDSWTETTATVVYPHEGQSGHESRSMGHWELELQLDIKTVVSGISLYIHSAPMMGAASGQ